MTDFYLSNLFSKDTCVYIYSAFKINLQIFVCTCVVVVFCFLFLFVLVIIFKQQLITFYILYCFLA